MVNYEKSLRKIYELTDEEFNNYGQEEVKPDPEKKDGSNANMPEVEHEKQEGDASNAQIVATDNHMGEKVAEAKEGSNTTEETKPKIDRKSINYPKALFYCSIYSSLYQLTGFNAVIFYSNSLFTNGEDGNSAEMKARIGSILVGVFSIVGVFISLFCLKYFAMLKISNFWHIIKLLCLVGMGIFSIAKIQIILIILALLFEMAFNCGIGSIMFPYTAQIMDSKGCAVVGCVNMFWTFIFGGFTNFMILYFTAQGFYFGLAVIQVFGILFVWIFLKEIKGLNKEECERVFMNKKTQDVN